MNQLLTAKPLALKRSGWLLAAVCLAVFLGFGPDDHSEPPDGQRAKTSATLITVEKSRMRDLPVVLESVGKVESKTSPTIDAEVEGRILQIMVDAGDAVTTGDVLLELDKTELELEQRAALAAIERNQAQIANEERRIKRFTTLKDRDLLSITLLDDTEAGLAVLRAQLNADQARLDIASDKLTKTSVSAPVTGRVEKRFVSVGDFVRRGDPLFVLAATEQLRAYLPFPEVVAVQIRPGLEVSLWSPIAQKTRLQGTIAELRPMVGSGSRAVWAIVDVDNPGDWRPEATVVAEVLTATHANAITIPERCVVRRPVGSVVYTISDNLAYEQPVELGHRVDDQVEVLSGLADGAEIACQGAHYLTDGATVRIAGAEQPAETQP